ncbi:NAD(P)-binding protein [Melanomma pulvis-pyrius CBS 109.77]|uniref:NAD(P)-binding protein n=1 Tax=Melanomma pulvis-pyrius CBS 109.77 TaxID=1314802 RepID=A0A6A6XU33_9PLEO|nr:NAD(P)-binding protein [Melanomma pulvis-pyrius CBS 109.77]
MSHKTALVIRATGSQGKAVTEHLLKAGWAVHALVRDPEDARALALKKIGASLHKGELSDKSSVEAALVGCTAVFLNQMPSLTDRSAETREAGAALDAAKKAGAEFVVHSTTLPLNDPNIKEKLEKSIVAPAILDKGDVEKLVKASGIPFAIIRPGYFMTNLIGPLSSYAFPDLASGKFLTSFETDTVLPLVDTYDIGAIAAAVFEDQPRYAGKTISFAGEKLGIQDIVKELSIVAGKEVEVVFRTEEETAKESATNPFIAGQTLSIGLHKLVDIEEVKKLGVPLTSFRQFLEKHKDAVLT